MIVIGRQKKQIKSIKQIADQIRKSKNEFQLILNGLSIPPITHEQDLTKRTPTIQTLLNDLPSEQRLKEMMDHPYAQTPQIRQKILSSYKGKDCKYKGKYEIIKRAGENIKNLKCQAQKIYYLAAQLNLYKIKNQFDPEHAEGINLKSYEIYQDQNKRLPKHEKNMINPCYLRDLRAQEVNAGFTTSQDFLQPGEPIINISLYDSIGGQKVFEYSCYGQQTLFQVVCKFYCLIARLEGKQATHWTNSYCLIQEIFYYYGNAAKKKIQQIVKFSKQNLEEQQGMNNQKADLCYEMSKIKLKNLRVVFGRPYLYRHLQGCDHIIIFKDLHILSENQLCQPARKDKYPLIVFQGRMRKRKCDGCRSKYAEWVSLNDPLKAGKHTYLCKECHANLHDLQRQDQTFIKYIHD